VTPWIAAYFRGRDRDLATLAINQDVMDRARTPVHPPEALGKIRGETIAVFLTSKHCIDLSD
jgi:1,2-phenylacetyl-CoA epoxidase catalytic subunit